MDQDPYSAKFLKFARRKDLYYNLIGVVLGSIGVSVVVSFLPRRFHIVIAPVFIGALISIPLIIYLSYWLALFRCPRCGNLFSGTWADLSASHCYHCGLTKDVSERSGSDSGP